MEIEVELGKGWHWALLPLALLVLVGLVLLGRSVTPKGSSLLTPAEWGLLKAERAYREELGDLRQAAEELAALLNARPDPVRAGLAADRAEQLALEGQPALALQREALTRAAEAVRLWAMGGGSREDAEVALAEAVQLLQESALR